MTQVVGFIATYYSDTLYIFVYANIMSFVLQYSMRLDGCITRLYNGVDNVRGVVSIQDLTRFNKICHPSQRPRWQVDKEAIGLSRVQQCSPTYNPPS